jgi:hypothetical protein
MVSISINMPLFYAYTDYDRRVSVMRMGRKGEAGLQAAAILVVL